MKHSEIRPEADSAPPYAPVPAPDPRRRKAERAAIHRVIGRAGRLSYLFGQLCARVPGLTYTRHILVLVPADGLPAMPRGYTARAVSRAELTLHSIDADAAVQAERFAAGMVCLGLFDRRDALLGVTWLARGGHEESLLGVRLHLPEGIAWDGGLWIDEQRRASRAFPALWAGVRQWLEGQGLHGTISSIADYNAASIAAHRRLGARTIGQVAVLRIGAFQCTLSGRLPPRLSLRRWPDIRVGTA